MSLSCWKWAVKLYGSCVLSQLILDHYCWATTLNSTQDILFDTCYIFGMELQACLSIRLLYLNDRATSHRLCYLLLYVEPFIWDVKQSFLYTNLWGTSWVQRRVWWRSPPLPVPRVFETTLIAACCNVIRPVRFLLDSKGAPAEISLSDHSENQINQPRSALANLHHAHCSPTAGGSWHVTWQVAVMWTLSVSDAEPCCSLRACRAIIWFIDFMLVYRISSQLQDVRMTG